MSAASDTRTNDSPRGIETGARDLAPQPVLDRQQQLDAAGTGADQRDARAPLACEHARAMSASKRLEEAVDRLDRNGVLGSRPARSRYSGSSRY